VEGDEAVDESLPPLEVDPNEAPWAPADEAESVNE
jgi:hypothetical protein